MALERESDHWVLPCQGLVVGQVRVDYAYGLEFTETPERAAEVSWRLRVGTPFVFTDLIGAVHRIDPEGPAEALGPALLARHQQLLDGDIWASGRIRMTFANGCVVEVEPDERYEAWTLNSSSTDGAHPMLVCSIGGHEIDWGR